MVIKPILMVLILWGCADTVRAEERRFEEGVIRQTEEVVNDSDAIYKVVVSGVEAGACGDKFDLYEGEVVDAFKGNLKSGSNFEFCGYAGLITYGSYAIGFNFDPNMDKLVFMPDAIYMESSPGEYFRILSYESHEYVVNGKRAILLGFEEPKLLEALLKAE